MDPSSESERRGRDGPSQPEAPTSAAEILLFRRYRVIRELGRGGMGVVVLAHDTALEIPVAVKLVPELVVKDTEAIGDLRKEVLRGMALMNPGIVRTHNFEKDETGAGIVMEFIEGHTLAELKTRQPGSCFEPGQILPWLEQLCPVLDYAHREAHIVHRDLKPRNVMLTIDARIKVADFGIAALISDSVSRHSMEGKISGTLSYMSPQQAEGRRPNSSDDVYSLGATIYELLTGKPPFFRGNPATILAQILTVVPSSMAERRDDLEVRGKTPLPPSWEATIADCLAKDSAKRPQTAGEVLARLRAGLHSSVSAFGLSSHHAAVADPPAQKLPELSVSPTERDSAPDWTGDTKRAPSAESAGSRAPSYKPLAWAGVISALIGAAAIALIRHPSTDSHPSANDLVAAATAIPAATPLSLASTPVAAAPGPSPSQPASLDPAPSPLTAGAFTTISPSHPWQNSLGMKFVPVSVKGGPTDSQLLLFSAWETRVQDYAAFAQATGQSPAKPTFTQTGVHPVVNVSWEDANAFCRWLTSEETKRGNLPAGWAYRLPSDHEWSCAAGIGEDEDWTQPPVARQDKPAGVFPWRSEPAPPREFANFGSSFKTDRWENTSPVGSFAPNSAGLYDLSGNVWELCSDRYDPKQDRYVARGAAWDVRVLDHLLLGHRGYVGATFKGDVFGFRCVLARSVAAGSASAVEVEPASAGTSSQPPATPPPAPTVSPSTQTLAKAPDVPTPAWSKQSPFTNSLGQKFVPTGTPGVLFCIWETRVQDYEAFLQATHRAPDKAPFKQAPTHPAVRVSWQEATAFCDWLTQREHEQRTLPSHARYRLPSDLEWSRAVGLGEEYGDTPAQRDSAQPGFPWGDAWPPPRGAGNYDRSMKTDDFTYTSPVGSFAPNRYGLFDLGGNAYEWVSDYFDESHTTRTVRGGSWADTIDSAMSAMRFASKPEARYQSYGFRCVLEWN